MANEPMYETNGDPRQYSCRGNFLSWEICLGNSCCGHRSLAGYRPWGRKAATKHRFGDADMRLVVAKGKRAWGKDELGVWG